MTLADFLRRHGIVAVNKTQAVCVLAAAMKAEAMSEEDAMHLARQSVDTLEARALYGINDWR